MQKKNSSTDESCKILQVSRPTLYRSLKAMCQCSLGLRIHFQIWDAFKVFLVVRQHNEIIVQCGCPKQDIKASNQLSSAAKVALTRRHELNLWAHTTAIADALLAEVCS